MTGATEESVGTVALASDVLRNAYGHFPTGVVAICAEVEGQKEALIVSSFVSVSLDPPLVAFCPQNTSSTWSRLEKADRLGVSVLGEHHDRVARAMASRTGDRFAGVEVESRRGGALLVSGASAWFETSIERVVSAGDHQLVLMRVHALDTHDPAPTIFHRSRFCRLADQEL